MTSAALDNMIASLDYEDTVALEKYVMFLIETKKKHSSKKKEALLGLRKYKGVLAGEDRESLRDEALEAKYGSLS